MYELLFIKDKLMHGRITDEPSDAFGLVYCTQSIGGFRIENNVPQIDINCEWVNESDIKAVDASEGFKLFNPGDAVLKLLLGENYDEHHDKVDTIKILPDSNNCSRIEFFEQAIFYDELLPYHDADFYSAGPCEEWAKQIIEIMKETK